MFNPEGGNYSWWSMRTGARSRNVGWRLDYVFVSENLRENVKSASIYPEIMGSDHCPVGLELEF
jgi:exodeoxyribonuclease-3